MNKEIVKLPNGDFQVAENKNEAIKLKIEILTKRMNANSYPKKLTSTFGSFTTKDPYE